MIDVDKFKAYNDAYGHQQGDVVLKVIAKTMNEALNRPGDYAVRWGGEEFAVLLPNTDIKAAVQIAERIRKSIGDAVIPCEGDTETQVTVSIGVNTQIPDQDSSLEAFISEADKLLYMAKELGRNRVCHPEI